LKPERPQPAALSLTRIEDLPALYTELYCARAFAEWRRLFADKAVVIRLDAQGKPLAMGIDEATRRFARFAASSNVLEEEWSEIDIRTTGNLATIRAHYRLTSDRDVREGTDLLTVMREGREWRIVCLAYEQTRHTPRPAQSGATHPRPSAHHDWERNPNLADLLTKQARQRPYGLAISLPGRKLSFGELDRLTWRCTALLAAHGVAAGDAVALGFTDELAGVVSMLATARRGATVWWIPRTNETLRRELLAASRAKICLTDTPGGAGGRITWLRPDVSPPVPDEPPVPTSVRTARPVAPWMIIAGSGSTGAPKNIPITHGQYLAQRRIYNHALDLGPSDTVASLLSFDSVVKRERFLDALLNGACVVVSPRPLPDPIGWLRQQNVRVLWSTVVQAERLLAAPGAGTADALPSLRVLMLGSSSVSEQLRRQIQARLTPNLHVYYGTNEVGLITLARPADLQASAQTVGTVVAGVRVQVVDAVDTPLPAGSIGQVRLQSPGLADGYHDNPQADRQAFRNGWFYPGDLGRFSADARLDYCGRADQMMVLDGTNIYPEEIERVLLACPGVADAATIPIRHKVHQDVPVCAIALEPGAPLSPAQLMRRAQEQLGFRAPRALVVLERIPRNEQGKLIRQELRHLLTARLAASAKPQTPQAGTGPMAGENLTGELIRHARSTPDAPCLLAGPDLTLSYRDVDQAVWTFSQHLHRHGLRAGDVLGLTIADELTLVLTMLAVIRLGATVFSIPRKAPEPRKRALAANAGIRALASDLPPPAEAMARHLPVSRGLINTRHEPGNPTVLCEKPQSPWLLITGSGTTGEPKLIPVTHAQTAARSRLAGASLRVTADDRLTSLSHFDFSTSKFRLHEALSAGAAYVLNAWNGKDPIETIRRLQLSVIYATVFHAETLLARVPRAKGPVLDKVRVLELTASTVSDSLRQRVRQGLCANLYVRYGINEAGPVSISQPPEVFDVKGTIGKPLAGVQVEIVDAQYRPMPPGNTGLIRIRSPGLVHRYHANEEATRRSFRDGWFTPGDLGRFTPEGELIYCGRADHMMIMNGMNIYPAEIERVLGGHPEVRDAAAMPIHHPVHQDVPICAVALHPGAQATEPDLLAWAHEQLGSQGPHRLFIVDEIPRNHEGKLVRPDLAEMLARRLANAQTRRTPD
jgi:acyl-CoA synthetase (AMP-forming)/AMP-acid ligase II